MTEREALKLAPNHKHKWQRYFYASTRWDGTYRYWCRGCDERIESYVGPVPEIEAALKEKNT